MQNNNTTAKTWIDNILPDFNQAIAIIDQPTIKKILLQAIATFEDPGDRYYVVKYLVTEVWVAAILRDYRENRCAYLGRLLVSVATDGTEKIPLVELVSDFENDDNFSLYLLSVDDLENGTDFLERLKACEPTKDEEEITPLKDPSHRTLVQHNGELARHSVTLTEEDLTSLFLQDYDIDNYDPSIIKDIFTPVAEIVERSLNENEFLEYLKIAIACAMEERG